MWCSLTWEQECIMCRLKPFWMSCGGLVTPWQRDAPLNAQGPERGIISRMDCLRPVWPAWKALRSEVPSKVCTWRTQEGTPQGVSLLTNNHIHRTLALDSPVPVSRLLFSISYISPVLVTNPEEGQSSSGMNLGWGENSKVILSLGKLSLPCQVTWFSTVTSENQK